MTLVAIPAFFLATGSYAFILFLILLASGIVIYIFTSRQPPTEAGIKPNWAAAKFMFVYIVFVLAVAWHALTANGITTQEALAVALWLLTGYPLWRYLKTAPDRLPWMALVVLNYGFYYGLFVLLPFNYEVIWRGIAEETRTYARILVLVGILIIFLVFYLWPRRFWEGKIPRIGFVWSEAKAKKFAFIAALIGLATNTVLQASKVPVAIHEPLNFVAQLSLVAIAILTVLRYKNRLSPWQTFFLYALIPLQILTDVAGGAVFPVTRLGVMLLMLYLYYRRDLPVLWILLALPLIVVLLGTKMEYRQFATRESAGTPIQKSLVFFTISYNFLTKSSGRQLYYGLEQVAQRFDMLSIFADVVNKTPYRVPYWGGETYTLIFWKFIPRFIYPDKPHEELGQEFGHRYGMLDPSDITTSMNLPQMVEMYANFGLAGFLIGTFLLGLLWQALDFSVNHPKQGEWSVVTTAVICSAFIDIESNFSITYGGLINWMIFMFILGKFVKPSPGEIQARGISS